VADDHEIIREGLIAMVAGTDVEIVGTATDGESAVQLAFDLKPHVVLLDVRMPGVDGLDVLGRVKAEVPQQIVLMMSSYDNPSYAARAVSLGASGYVLKDAPREEFLKAIRQAANGQDLWSREKLRRVSGSMATVGKPTNAEVALTRREQDVLIHMANGKTNKEIGEYLEISAETVKEHVKHLLTKIGVTDRTQAAVWAVRHGII
jgi:DNA-binding NarL/FixJ family response regulator